MEPQADKRTTRFKDAADTNETQKMKLKFHIHVKQCITSYKLKQKGEY